MKVMTNYEHSEHFTANRIYTVDRVLLEDDDIKALVVVTDDNGEEAWIVLGTTCAFLGDEGVWEIVDEPELSADDEQSAFNKFLDKRLPVSPPDVNRHVSGSVGSTDPSAGQTPWMNLVVADHLISKGREVSSGGMDYNYNHSSSYDSGSSSSSSSSGCD